MKTGLRKRFALGASVAVAGVLALPGLASAAVVTTEPGPLLTFQGSVGEINDLEITPTGNPNEFLFDDVVPITDSSPDCTGLGDLTCTAPAPGLVDIRLGDQDDSLDFTTVTSGLFFASGENGADTIDAGSGSDLLFGDGTIADDGAADILNGGANADAFDGGNGADVITGGGGGGPPDGVRYSNHTSGVTVTLGDGIANDGNADDGSGDTLTGIDNVEGSPFDDTLVGNANINDLTGLAGSDDIDGAGGQDSTGYPLHTTDVTADVDGESGDDGSSEDGLPGFRDTLSDIEDLAGGEGDDTLTGDGSPNFLSGHPGSDTLNGGGGVDTLVGGDNNDNLLGGGGNDQLNGEAGSDRALFTGAAGSVDVNLQTGIATGEATTNDTLFNVENVTGSSFGDTIRANDQQNSLDGAGGEDLFLAVTSAGSGLGDDSFTGGAGFSDQLTYDESTSGHTFNVPGTQVTGDTTTDTFASMELFLGSATQGDTFTGGAGVDNFDGLGGNDVATGGANNDDLEGGSGNDTLSGNAGIDLLVGGIGPGDTADYSTAAVAVTSNLSAQTTSNDGDTTNDNLSGIENLTGSAGGDDLRGSSDPNTINSLAGADTVRVRDSGPDTVDCGAQTDLAIVDATETSIMNCETSDDPSAPPAPGITGSSPGSGADDNSPEISGTAPAGSTASLYETADCSGTSLATGPAASFASPGLTVNVADNSTTTLRASATLPLDSDVSACSPAFSYSEVTPADGGGGGGGRRWRPAGHHSARDDPRRSPGQDLGQHADLQLPLLRGELELPLSARQAQGAQLHLAEDDGQPRLRQARFPRPRDRRGRQPRRVRGQGQVQDQARRLAPERPVPAPQGREPWG